MRSLSMRGEKLRPCVLYVPCLICRVGLPRPSRPRAALAGAAQPPDPGEPARVGRGGAPRTCATPPAGPVAVPSRVGERRRPAADPAAHAAYPLDPARRPEESPVLTQSHTLRNAIAGGGR